MGNLKDFQGQFWVYAPSLERYLHVRYLTPLYALVWDLIGAPPFLPTLLQSDATTVPLHLVIILTPELQDCLVYSQRVAYCIDSEG
jgi:hypothetical protein